MTAAHAEVKTIKDVLGREVKVDVPAKRIMLGFYYTDYLAVGGEKALDNVVGFSKAVWTDWTPASWEVYSKTLPKLNELADVGDVEVGTPLAGKGGGASPCRICTHSRRRPDVCTHRGRMA